MKNIFKLFILMLALTFILLWLGKAIGGQTGMVIALIFAGIMNFVSYYYSDKIVLAMYKAKPISEQQAPQIYETIKQLCNEANIPIPRVYLVSHSAANAFATGRNPQNACLVLTEGIVNLLDQRELKGVIGHELSHIKHRDILVATVVATLAGAVTLLAYMVRWGAILGGIGGRDKNNNVLGLLVMSIIAPIAALLIQLAVSRSREYLADKGSANLTKDPLSLANALEKLHFASRRIPLPANNVTSHLFIVNPLKTKGIATLFSTHPPVEERVKRLKELV